MPGAWLGFPLHLFSVQPAGFLSASQVPGAGKMAETVGSVQCEQTLFLWVNSSEVSVTSRRVGHADSGGLGPVRPPGLREWCGEDVSRAQEGPGATGCSSVTTAGAWDFTVGLAEASGEFWCPPFRGLSCSWVQGQWWEVDEKGSGRGLLGMGVGVCLGGGGDARGCCGLHVP